MSQGREDLPRLARELAEKQREASELARRLALLIWERKPLDPVASPFCDPELVAALAELPIHMKDVVELDGLVVGTLVVLLLSLGPDRREIAGRIQRAVDMGQETAKESCTCPKCNARRAEADAVVAASLARARGAP